MPLIRRMFGPFREISVSSQKSKTSDEIGSSTAIETEPRDGDSATRDWLWERGEGTGARCLTAAAAGLQVRNDPKHLVLINDLAGLLVGCFDKWRLVAGLLCVISSKPRTLVL